MSWHPTCAALAEAARPTGSGLQHLRYGRRRRRRWWRRSAKPRPSWSVMIGARRSPGMRRCFVRYFHRGRGPERAAAVPRPRQAARPAAGKRHHQFLLAILPGARRRRSRARARPREDVCASCLAAADSPIRPPRCSCRPARDFSATPAPIEPLPAWLTEADLADFPQAFRKSGFRGGLNWYRNLDRNWELTAPWQDAQIHQPSLFIAGSQDAVITGLIGAKRVNELERVLPNLTRQADHRRRRPLGSAGAAGRGQRRPDRVPASEIALLR